MLGQKLKELREAKGLVQRQVAAKLHVDTAYLSKIESNEKPLNRQHLKKLASLFAVEEKDLLTLWLADKVYDMLRHEQLAEASLEMAQREIRQLTRSERKEKKEK